MTSGIGSFWENVKALPRNLRTTTIRHGMPTTDRVRSQAVFGNLFLHIHPPRFNTRSLKLTTTWALGVSLIAQSIILTITGILLMVYYKPSVELAYDSIKDLHYVVPTGRFMRNIHRWASHMMVVCVFLHMSRVFYTAAYKAPREFNWVLGMGLFVMTLLFSFTGYLLPWDQLAYWAITIGAAIAGSPNEVAHAMGLPHIFYLGDILKEILLGASTVGEDALLRFYVLHCIALPVVFTAFLGVHVWRVRKDGGLAHPEDKTDGAGKSKKATTWPYLLRAELLVFMVTMLICVVLGLMFDAPLRELANPSVPENPAKAPWYFLGLQEMVSYSAFVGGIVVPVVTILGLALIPYLDREKERSGVWFSGARGRATTLVSVVFGAIAAVLAVAIPVNYGWLREWYPDIPQLLIIVFNPGSLLTAAYALWSLAVMTGTRSTRLGAIALFTCFLVGFVILTYVGTYLRGPNWDFFWSSAQWPAH